MPRSEKWTLVDVLDFEALIAADERATDPAAVATRDARLWREQIAPHLSVEQCADRSLVFHRWLESRRPGEVLPGKWLTAAWSWFSAAAMLGGLIFGFAVASGALYYSGSRPVNVAIFLAITVGVQWVLLAWSLVVIVSRGIRAASQNLLARIGEGIGEAFASVAAHLSGERRLRLRAEIETLRQLSGRNLQLLCWKPLMELQTFGIFWNAGVLAALLGRVLFTDVAFGWESTVANSPQGMHTAVVTLATPWLLLGFNFCPSLWQVEHSWFHYQSGMGGLDRTATASWWPWLVLCVFVYGVVPRSLLRTYFRNHLRLSLRQLVFDEPRHRAAWYRLTGPLIQSDRPPQEGFPPAGSDAIPLAARRVEAGCLILDSPFAGGRAEIEKWVTAHLGWRLVSTEIVEIDYPSGNDAALARLAAVLPQAPCWIVAVPAPFTAFSAFTQFLARMQDLTKSAAGSEGFVLVVALDPNGKPGAPEPQWARYWSDFLRAEAAGCATLPYTP